MTRCDLSCKLTRLVAPKTLVGLMVLAIAFSLPAFPAQAPQQPAAQAGTQQDKGQKDKAQADKASADKGQQKQSEAPKPPAPESSRRVYSIANGTGVYYRTEEHERKPTKDGEVETQRIREPSWSGDRRVLLEREVRTKNLPDGTVEKEYVTKNTDGADHVVPTQIVRERVKKSGDKTTIERETLTQDGDGHWNPIQKEKVSETGPDSARKSVKEVLAPDLTGQWKVVEREEGSSKNSKEGQESHTVRQLPDAYGRMADYEVQDEKTSAQGGKQTHEVSLKRREFQDTDHPKFFLVDRTVETKEASPDGKKVTTHTTTESDLLDGYHRDLRSNHPQVVKETTEVDTKGTGGEKKVVDVKQRNAGDPNGLRPAYQVVQETDKDGHVRQVYLPSNK